MAAFRSVRATHVSHIDAAKTPGEMDIHLGATAWSTEGGKRVPLNATTMKGIFEIRRHASDPKQDTLRWCFAQPSQPRPTSFKVDEGSGQTSVELQRFIVNEEEIVAKLKQAGATVYKDNEGGWVTEIVLPSSFDSKVAMQTIPDLRKLASVVSYVADQELANSLTDHLSVRSLRFRCQVTPDHLDQLASSLPNLKTLGFRCKELTEAHCSAIQKGKLIRWLQIGGNEDDLSSLRMLEDLQIGSLSLFHCKLSRACFDRIADHMPKLSSLEITGSLLATDALTPVIRMERLYSLDLKGKSIADEHLLTIKSQTNLRILEISDTAVTHLSLKHVLRNFPKVFSVRAENVAFDRGIFKVIASAAQDRQFYVTVSNSSVSREEVENEGEDISRRIKVIGR